MKNKEFEIKSIDKLSHASTKILHALHEASESVHVYHALRFVPTANLIDMHDMITYILESRNE